MITSLPRPANSSGSSTSAYRAIANTRSEARFRNRSRSGDASSPASPRVTTRRSARRITVRATSSWAESVVPPGSTNFGGRSTRSMYLSISGSSSPAISGVIRLTPSSRRSAASGAVASSAPAIISSSWTRRMSAASSASSPHSERATPSAELASSSDP